MRRGLALFLSFSGAVLAAVCLLPDALWPWLGLAALAPAGLFLWRKRVLGTAICLGVSAALLWCAAYHAFVLAGMEELAGRRTKVEFHLGETPTASAYGAYVSGWVTQPGRLPVQGTLYGPERLLELSPGDAVTVVADCSKTAFLETEPFAPNAAKGVFLLLTARGAMEVDRAEHPPVWCLPRLWGERLSASLQAVCPPDVSGLLRALAAGDREGLDRGQYNDLTRSGIAHVVAVSGMHVCFLVGVLTLFTGYDPRRRAAVCVPAVVFFALAVGAAPSILRACAMQTALLLAPVLGREADRWTSVGATLALLLLLNPFSAANVGLQLSFAALVGIGLVTPRLRRLWSRLRLPGESRPRRAANAALTFLLGVLATTLGALVFTLPLTAYYFGTVSLAAPLTNLLVIPVASILFAGALATGLVGMVLPAAGGIMGQVLAWPARYVLWVARRVAAFPYSAVTLTDIYYPVALLGGYALLLVALLWTGERRRARVFALCAAALVAGAALFTRLSFHTAQLTLGVLDVGQGQSIALCSGGETGVIDCGGSGYQDPGDVCADFLADRGETTLDKLILTHYHADHANGLEELFRRLEVREVILPQMEHDEETQSWVLDLARQEGAAVTWVAEDMDVPLGEARLRVYAPLGDGGANEEGLSAVVSAGDFHALVTGDMNATVEKRLVKYGALPRCQVLVVGHHGSRYASDPVLLETVRPENALISVGENTYGHPAQETLDRLAGCGAAVYRTDQWGSLTVQVP